MNKVISVFIVLFFAVTVVSFAQESSQDHSMTTDSMSQSNSMDSMDSEMHDASMLDNRPEWHNLELVNAITGETFTLASLNDKTVFIEPMATWCTNCTRQLSAVDDVKTQLTDEELGEDFVFLAVSLEGNIANEKLASHAERLGSSLNFAVATPELIRGISESFGRGALNPSSTPHFIIKSNGEMTELQTGMETSEQIYDELVAAHDSAMMMEQSN